MKTKILILEHDPNDIELIQYELKSAKVNYVAEIVATETEFIRALLDFKPDIILSDYSVPNFNGANAFKIKQDMAPLIPFIFVSGTIGEEKAVEHIKNGVTDYAFKDKLFSLPQKVIRALKDAKEKEEKRVSDEKLIKSNRLYAFISQVNQNIVHIKDEKKLFRDSCRIALEFGKFKMAWIGLFDDTKKEITLVAQNGIPEDDIKLFINAPYEENGPQDYVLRNDSYYICNNIQNKLGLNSWKPYVAKYGIQSCLVLPIKKAGKIIGSFNLYSTQLNFSEEEEIALLIEVAGDISFALDLFENELQKKKITAELLESESRFIEAQRVAKIGSWETNLENLNVIWSEETYRIFELNRNDFMPSHTAFLALVHPEDRRRVDLAFTNSIGKEERNIIEHRIITSSNKVKFVEERWRVFYDDEEQPIRIAGTCQDITEHKQTEKKLLYSEARLKEAQTLSHISNWEIDLVTNTHIWSDEFYAIFKLKKGEITPSEETFLSLLHPEDIDNVRKAIEKTFETSVKSKFYSRINTKDGTERWIYSEWKFEFDSNKKPIRLYGILQDITESKIAEKKIKESEVKYRSLVEQASDAIILVQSDGAIVETNTRCEKLLGYTKGELRTMALNDLLFGEDIKRDPPRGIHLHKGEKVIYQRRLKKKNNTSVDVEISAGKTEDGRIIGIIRDITERKKAEEKAIKSEKQIRNFARHLNQILEEERAHIAREIHDELGQQLVGIKIGLSSFLGNTEEMSKTVKEMKKTVDGTIQSLRIIATELRPGILDTLGLIPSIEWLGKEFEKKTGIKCEIDINVKEQTFEKDISICFFRICQEALTNISKHAKASEVIITAKQNNKQLTFTISDNGKGIATEKLENPFSMGLLGMRERANIIDAKLAITSTKGVGTTVKLSVNLK